MLNSILFTKSNVLHPAILTPNQLYKELINSVSHLPRYREFPIKIDLDTIHRIIILSDLSCYSVDNKIVFIIKVPLVHHTEYYLYKNIPLPVPHNSQNPNSYAMIIPTTEYIALSEDKTSFCTLSLLNSCKQIGSQLFICNKVNEYSSVDSSSSCELEIMTKRVSSLPKSCNVRFLSGNVNILEKLSDNKWLYVQSESSKLSIECNSDLTELSLSGTGVLNLPENCIAYFKNIRLFSKSSPKISINEIKSDFNLINDTCCNIEKFKSHLPSMSYINLTSLNLENLSGIKSKADDI
ncbi:baculovirus F protein domain-containing protein [Phthorimaea operculella]|nr:baculovirus F protein domain-containing protein [Phthorimaea operculella]